jgi:deferrochelatase/peroxidase EfeB
VSTTAHPTSRVKPPLPGDIQKLVTSGYRAECSRHLILTVLHAALARQFLHQLRLGDWLVDANQPWDGRAGRCALSLGITFAGLKKLELDDRLLDVLRAKAPAFAQGAWARAKDQLGDVGNSTPGRWDASFGPDSAHLLLILHANDVTNLAAATDKLKRLAHEQAFATHWAAHDGVHLGTGTVGRRVHFDMLDGLSKPTILPEPPGPEDLPNAARNSHRLGEFVLGYDNDDQINPWRLAAERPASTRVPAEEQSRALAEFFKNGSFAAFRKMAQDEAGFRSFVRQQAQRLQGKQTQAQAEAFIRAKLLGRWDDGRVVQAKDTMDSGPTGPSVAAAFDFAGDQTGLGCPFGAHIRRMNPRDDPVVPIRRRPILRRGMPYGEVYLRDDGQNDGQNRGLLGLFFCASLEHQFEHLVGQWANDTPMGPNNRGNARDPLIGHNDPARHVYDIPLSDTTALALRGLTPFVTTKGTLYAFFPSLSAIKQLAEPPAPVDGTNRPYACETGLARL